METNEKKDTNKRIEDSGELEADGAYKALLSSYNELKEKTVSKEEYDKLFARNGLLLNQVTNNAAKNEAVEKAKVVEDVGKLRKELFGKEHSNLEYIELALRLREELLARHEKDPFLPYGDHISVSQLDYDSAEKVAEEFKEMLKQADGDPAIFNNELSRRIAGSSNRR